MGRQQADHGSPYTSPAHDPLTKARENLKLRRSPPGALERYPGLDILKRVAIFDGTTVDLCPAQDLTPGFFQGGGADEGTLVHTESYLHWIGQYGRLEDVRAIHVGESRESSVAS